PGVLADDLGHQLVGVQTALHQQLRFAEAHQLDRLLSGGVAVRDIDDIIPAKIELQLLGDGPDLRYWADENWQNDPGFRRVYCARQRRVVARVRNCRRDRWQSLAASNQPIVFLVLAEFGGALGAHCDLAALHRHFSTARIASLRDRLRSLTNPRHRKAASAPQWRAS